MAHRFLNLARSRCARKPSRRVSGASDDVVAVGIAGLIAALLLGQTVNLGITATGPAGATVGAPASFLFQAQNAAGASGITITAIFQPAVDLFSLGPAGVCRASSLTPGAGLTPNKDSNGRSTTIICALTSGSSVTMSVIPLSAGNLNVVAGVIAGEADPYMPDNEASFAVAVGAGVTPTPTPTATPTNTPAGQTPTVTPTFTPTRTPTVTPTATATPIGTTIFTTQVPATNIDSGGHELGAQFTSSQNGTVVALRFWKAPGETGIHTGRLWTDAGTQLASVVFANETASGWQERALGTPVTISNGVSYRVSYNGNTARSSTVDGLSSPIMNGPLTGLKGCNNQVAGNFPGTLTTNNSFADLRFQSAAATATPTFTPAGPTNTPTRTPTNTRTATPTRTPTNTPTGTKPQTPTRTPTNMPTATPTRTPTRTPTITVTRTPTPTPVTIFTTQVPATNTNSGGHELGTQFTSSQNGTVVAFRFWKAPGETGTHTGRLWTDAGSELASVVFTNEASSGWQEQALATPVTISHGLSYRVSYNANTARSLTVDGLFSPIMNGPLTGLKGCNNLVAGNFPGTLTTNNTFADLRFQR